MTKWEEKWASVTAIPKLPAAGVYLIRIIDIMILMLFKHSHKMLEVTSSLGTT